MNLPETFLTAEWRHLAMLHYPIDRAVLEPLVPPGTVLDTYRGIAYVSVVAFRFLRARVLGLAVPFHEDFSEINLRFYVRRLAGEDWRRGVVFVREFVPLRVVALAARRLYNEPYLATPMRHDVEVTDGAGSARATYEWQWGGRWHRVAVEATGTARPVAAGSVEEFLTDLHWGYTRQRDGGTVEYQVDHPLWPVRLASRAGLECDVRSVYGEAFAATLSAPPAMAHLVAGSAVRVSRPVRLHSGG
ncbi:MAG TPA: DUF2071 domain-containing protein [Methylomirabilota bacterium]|nr:DUF2071 domain-containing protein [Methylomirabilota bacterium]